MSTRRTFIKQSLFSAGALILHPSPDVGFLKPPGLQISLAQWSLHKMLKSGKLDHLDFPAKARKDFDISVVEYVNGFFGGNKMNFKKAAKNTAYLNELLKRS